MVNLEGQVPPAPDRPIAFLVDAENASTWVKHEALPALVKEMLAEASKYGPVVVRRVYGNWTAPQMAAWKGVQEQFALKPVQQFAYVAGKNATDMALVIEAMDLLHGGIVKGFCIVSGDSDFTGLATRIREGGLFVMVVGSKSTHGALRSASDVFVPFENLVGTPTGAPALPTLAVPGAKAASRAGAPKTGPAARDHLPGEALEILSKAFDLVSAESGRTTLAELGSAARRLDPGFDPRTYGFNQLVKLVAALPEQFVLERPGAGKDYVSRKSTPRGAAPPG